MSKDSRPFRLLCGIKNGANPWRARFFIVFLPCNISALQSTTPPHVAHSTALRDPQLCLV
ncbi:hypothetical protein HMPREF9136_2090 [Prevotella dentalis DSM 3688]|uniref:Uncharacterized protein n=1 Tax=Prevotella dentalis (strain ATCC 49559 / DSM 3688 / JCM 13448 / NCTC 12043 / ES 2772) TaxID=908937 RepID=F9D5G2_PREDD|nr:hypothetical protein HMPREF9136_2090 [Prevotella dentalis DSM 3688]